MRHRSLAAVLLAAISLVAFAAPSPGADRGIEGEVDAYLAPLRSCDVFQGVVLVARGDRVLVEKGYGYANVELGVPNTPRRVFRIASLTKVFTEVLLGRLAERGTLRLSDPLSRFLPDFPRGDSITLEMLRTHRAGIPSMNSIPFDEEADVQNTLDSLVRVIATRPLDFPPGSRQRYSNGGYAVLAAAIERAAGAPYADVLEREVLRPLGLAHTRHEDDGMLVPDRAFGYVTGATERHALVPAPFQQMATKTGGGSLVSTAGDLHRLLRAFYRDGVIHDSTWRALFPLDDSLFAYQGRCPGYNVFMARDFARDLDVVVLCNNYAGGMVADVGRDLMALAAGRHPAPPPWRADLAADSAACARYVGSYVTGEASLPYGQGPFGVAWQDGGLRFSIGDSPVDYMLPQSPGVFLVRRLWSEVRFEPAAAGGAPAVTIRPLWFKTDPIALRRVEPGAR